MRILHTVAWYHPDDGGGAQEVVRRISEGLAKRGHEVTVATSHSASRREFVRNGVQIEQFKIRGVLGHSALGITGETERFATYLRSQRFDVILNYAAQTWGTDLTCRHLGRLTAKTVLATCGFSGLLGLRKIAYSPYYTRLPKYLKQYDAVVYHAESYIDKQFGDRLGLKNSRIIPNGVDGGYIRSAPPDFRERYGISAPHVVLSVGNHFNNKGHGRVIRAFEEANRSDAVLVIIGGRTAPRLRSCWRSCRRSAASSGGRVIMLEGLAREDVLAAFMAADVFLFGSYVEAFPLVLLEAMASGTPFVSFPAGNAAELPGGTIVNSTSRMAAELCHLLDHPSRRNELAAVGLQEQRERYEWEQVIDRYEEMYEELLKPPSTGRYYGC